MPWMATHCAADQRRKMPAEADELDRLLPHDSIMRKQPEFFELTYISVGAQVHKLESPRRGRPTGTTPGCGCS